MPPIPPSTPRVITYHQTHHSPAGDHVSLLPLLTSSPNRTPSITHLILAAVHINGDPHNLTLNDHPPSHPRNATLFAELRILQASGVKVLAMLGGAAKGSYERLDYGGENESEFERYYLPFRDFVREKGLDGVDLDVEEEMSLAGIVRLVDRLRADFGKSFLITMAPVASALLDRRHNLSGFDYEALEVMRGTSIDWYHAQFYCGWGDCSNPVMYELILARGWPAQKVVMGMVTNPENGAGFVGDVPIAALLPALLRRHPGFGGVSGWEYFNSLPGGRAKPWLWAEWMSGLLRGGVEDVAVGKVGSEKVAARKADEIDPDDGGSDAPLPDVFEYITDASDED